MVARRELKLDVSGVSCFDREASNKRSGIVHPHDAGPVFPRTVVGAANGQADSHLFGSQTVCQSRLCPDRRICSGERIASGTKL